MIKTVVGIEGMMCPHCEAHIRDAFTKAFSPESVTASHERKQAEMISAEKPDADAIKKLVEDAGYTFVSETSEEI
ncbi:MAG: heavy-metal-associated domain-containing protein [Ruminococcus sp.]|nr:heavy-metal-associated domain-containing protein [Ruminococcus sp.]